MTPHTSNIPNPEERVLTTEQLYQEISALREVIEAHPSNVDKATPLLPETVVARQAVTDQQINHPGELHGEGFGSIDGRILDCDVHVEQASIAGKTIFDVALQALTETAEEQHATTIAKAGIATIKQIDSLHAIIESNNDALIVRFGELKERLDRCEATTRGAREKWTENRLDTALMVAIVGMCTVVLSVLAGLVGFSLHN
jgi:hypothetical protein